MMVNQTQTASIYREELRVWFEGSDLEGQAEFVALSARQDLDV